jgi:hypothetical protein
MPRSWIALIRRKDGRVMHGVARELPSSRFGGRADAENLIAARLDGVGGYGRAEYEGEVIASDLPPEIWVHCAGGPLQALGSICPRCGARLTYPKKEQVP